MKDLDLNLDMQKCKIQNEKPSLVSNILASCNDLSRDDTDQ